MPHWNEPGAAGKTNRARFGRYAVIPFLWELTNRAPFNGLFKKDLIDLF